MDCRSAQERRDWPEKLRAILEEKRYVASYVEAEEKRLYGGP